MGLVELPYFADDAAIPESLPTCSAIRSSTDVLSDTSTQRVVGVGLHFVVKYGSGVELKEGQNMLYVQQVTRVSVPRVYALFRESETGEKYIVMERINGRRLDVEWGLLSQDEKRVIACKLKASFEELRQLPSPGGFCSVGKGPLLDDIFWTDGESASLRGPFSTESTFNDAIIEVLSRAQIPSHKVAFYKRAFRNVFCKNLPTFTLGNFQRSSLIVQEGGNTCRSGSKTMRHDVRVFLLNWKYAGWYPCYWEYARSIFIGVDWRDDWDKYIDQMMPTFPVEWSWMGKVLTDLWT